MQNNIRFLTQLGKFAAITAVAAVLSCGLSNGAKAQVLPTNPPPDPTCTVPAPTFNGWFLSGRAGFNQPVKPADSIAFNANSNCSFYLWSEQMFLWLTSPASGAYQGNRVFDSQIFYQLLGGKLVRQIPFAPLNLALRAAQVGPDGLPVLIDSQGQMREFVTAPRRSGVTALSAVHGKSLAQVSTVQTGPDGKAILLDARGRTVTLTPKVTADMLPQTLGRLAAILPPAHGLKALTAVSQRQQIADALTAKKVLIAISTGTGRSFVEAGTGIVDSLEPGQAGGNGVLISQRNSVIFYETLVNDVYAWYLTGRKTPNGIPPFYASVPPVNYGLFPTSATDLTSIVNFSATHGGPRSFPDGVALAFETKLSWVDASTLPNGAAGYITSQALVPVYNTSNPADWVPAGNRLTTVALVGVHVVGSANGHPEMIWGTFEHLGNTPLASYQYNSGGKPVTVQQNTSGGWLFSANGATQPFNTELAQYCPSGVTDPEYPCTTNNYSHIVASVATPTPPIPPIKPSNILRQKPWGVGSNGVPNQEDATPAAANTEIIALDTNVRAQLAAAGASADPRYNYLFIGATWTFFGGEPNGPFPAKPGNNEIGSSMLLNSTMETFQQGKDTLYQTGRNCFGCHGSSGDDPKVPADTFVSHIFGGTSPLPLPPQ